MTENTARSSKGIAMAAPDIVSSDDVRSAFSDAMSTMYRDEVPLYGELVDIVASVNEAVLAHDEALQARLAASPRCVSL